MRKLVLLSVLMLAVAALALPAFAQVDPTPTVQADDPVIEASPAAPTTVPLATPVLTEMETADESVVPQTGLMGPTTVDFISSNFVRLTEAIQAAGMADILTGSQYTVFVPNDGAFQTLLNDLDISLNDLLANRRLLEGVLSYHAVPGIITSSDIMSGTQGALETVHGAALTFGFDNVTSRVTINNGAASIEQADIYTSTGIVHIIDNVLLPPNAVELMMNPILPETTDDAATGKSLAGISQDTFVVLTEAVQAAGLTDELASGEYTLFAPNDGAFVTLLNDLDMSYADLLANQQLLQNVLTYHLVPGTVTAEELQNGVGALQTVNGATLNFGFNPGTSRVIINNGAASVEHPDIFANNGVVHIIDNVLLPPQ